MKSITVINKEELEKARKEKYDEIIVIGELANKLKKGKKIAFLSKMAILAITAVIGTSIATAPVTGGASMIVGYAGIAPVATITGVEIAAIIAAASVGISLIAAVFLGYEEISYKKGELILRKKQK